MPAKSSRRLQALVVRSLYALANGLLSALRVILWPHRRPLSAKRVCVYRIGNIGDTVCALPAIYAVRKAYPRAHLTLLASPGRLGAPGAAELLAGANWLDEIILYHAHEVTGLRARLRLVRRLRKRAFDVWFDIPQHAGFVVSLRNMIAARAAGARWGYGWRVATIRICAQAQSEFMQFPGEVDRLMTVVRDAGLTDVAPVFVLPLGKQHRRAADRLLGATGRSPRLLAALAPAAKRSTNRWPAERFAEVARRLAQSGLDVVVLGGASDAERCARVAAAAGTRGLNLAGRTSLLESCEVLSRCSIAVCNDSGVQHLAAAMGTPCVSLFSCRDMPGKWHPYGAQHGVLRKWVDCHTCLLADCPYDNLCIKKIEVDEVIEAVERTLGQHPHRTYAAASVQQRRQLQPVMITSS